MMLAPVWAPPVIELLFGAKDLSEGGSTLNCTEADPELSVAVSVTGVDVVTWPACIWNCIHAVFAGMVTVAGTGAALGLELARLIAAPEGPAAALNWICTNVVFPLKSWLVIRAIETGDGGAELTVNVPVADQAVTAAVLGEASP